MAFDLDDEELEATRELNGVGSIKEKQCPKCNGTGMVGEYIPYFQAFVDYECKKCKGKGWIKEKECK